MQSQLVSQITILLFPNKSSYIQNINEPLLLQKINEKYPLNILVAEDNAINQKLMSNLFVILGYTIHIATNGLEAIDILKRTKIDIVFMDMQMPEMDGLEATRQIIAQWGNQKPLIVSMTANALESDKQKCKDAGMDDFISKPLTINQVGARIKQWALLVKLSK